jgi:hypothetical protein
MRLELLGLVIGGIGFVTSISLLGLTGLLSVCFRFIASQRAIPV